LEKSLLTDSKKSAQEINQAIWTHPLIQAGIEKKYRHLSPWWDRQLLPAERNYRWDVFLESLQTVENWDHCNIKIQPDRKLEEILSPAEYAEQQLHKLHEADLQVKRTIHIDRKASKNTGGEEWQSRPKYEPDKFIEQESCL